MVTEPRRCVNGVWDDSIPGIEYDENGASNYSKLFHRLIEAYPRGIEGRTKFEGIVDKIKKAKGNKKYDCIIGVSGGTDSSYLLHLAKKEFGLNPLAVTFDNGWSSDIAVKNIKRMTSALNIDLETYVVDYEEIKDLIRSYMYAGLPWIDLPTDLGIKAICYRIAAREGVRFVLRGNDFRSEGSQPNEWTYGDGRQLKAIHKLYGKIPLKTFPNYTISSLVYYALIKRIMSIYPFYYLDYEKKSAQSFLIENYGWEYYGGHHHENLFTKFAITYWLFEKFGIDKRLITLSAQVLSGEISRDSAIDQLKMKPFDEDSKDFMIDYVIKKLDFSKDEFNQIMNSPSRTYLDYPSYDYLFRKLHRLSSFLMRFFFIHKPQSLFQAEMRKG